MTPSPCTCTEHNPECKRYPLGPMTLRLYELCSGRCPPERPCTPEMSNAFRANCDGMDPLKQHTLLSQAKSLATATGKHIANNLQEVDEPTYQERRSLCDACPQRDAATDRCTICGCHLNNSLLNKLKMASESCPAGKWLAVSMK